MEEIGTAIKKRGRPKGSRRLGVKKWQPKTWKPLYDEIVALSIAGKSNIDIAQLKDFTPQQVSNVLNCDEGIKRKFEIAKRIKDTLDVAVEERSKDIVNLTLTRARDLLKNDEAFIRNPLGVIKVGIAVGRATGEFDDGASKSKSNSRDSDSNGNTFIGNQTLNILTSPTNAQLIVDALAKSDEAKRLNAVGLDSTKRISNG